MEKMKAKGLKAALLTGAIVIAGAVPVSAIVTYDEADVYEWDWFVGKGDVQSAFGWTAKQSDANFENVLFIFTKETVTVIGCVDTARGTYTEVIGSKTDSQTTDRATATEIRKKTITVTGAFVTKTGAPVTESETGECSAGYERNNLREVSVTEKLTALISETIKGKTQVSSAIIWTS
jgi:hypothetical protein